MMRSRLLLALLGASIALVASLALTSCGSGNGRGEKKSDVVRLDNEEFQDFALAAAPNGSIALVWDTKLGDRLELRELSATSWRWSQSETVTSVGENGWAPPGEELVIAYDGLGRLLVAWGVDLVPGPTGFRWGIKARLRDSGGNWQQERLIARLTKKDSIDSSSLGLEIASGKRGFALSWYTGFRVLDRDSWSPPVRVRASELALALPDVKTPLAMWISQNGRLDYASLRPDSTLGDSHVLARADYLLATASQRNYIVVAWSYNSRTWASVWNGHRWSLPQPLGKNDPTFENNIAVAISGERAMVAWDNPNDAGIAYVLEDVGSGHSKRWKSPTSLDDSSAGIAAVGALASGEFVLVRSICCRYEITHIPRSTSRPASDKKSYEELKFTYSSGEAFASSPKVTALAWAEDTGPEGDTDPHIQVWVYRP